MRKRIFFPVLLTILLIPGLALPQSCYPDQSDEFWKIGGQYGSKLISACHPDAIYNCHGFVMSYFENGCTQPSWMAPMIPAPYTCPNVAGLLMASSYQTSVKYVKVCTEDASEIIYVAIQIFTFHQQHISINR